jgi:hypothetical protein
MEKGTSWEANRVEACVEIPRILWNRKFIATFPGARHLSLSWDSST